MCLCVHKILFLAPTKNIKNDIVPPGYIRSRRCICEKKLSFSCVHYCKIRLLYFLKTDLPFSSNHLVTQTHFLKMKKGTKLRSTRLFVFSRKAQRVWKKSGESSFVSCLPKSFPKSPPVLCWPDYETIIIMERSRW